MGSAQVEYLVTDEHLHVARDPDGYWWAVARVPGNYVRWTVSSYGGSRDRRHAIKIALDASATGYHGKKKIVIHYIGGKVACVLKGTKQPPSSQFFQDAVP